MKRSRCLVVLTVLAMVLAACGSDASDVSSGDAVTADADVDAPTDSESVAEDGGSQSDEASTTAASVAAEGVQLSVVVTTTIWGDVVTNVVGDDVNVEVLFPIGADPHDHQLSAAQVASMQDADLVVVNGLMLEEGILDVVESIEDDGANILEIGEMLDPIPFGETGHSDEHDHGDDDQSAEGDYDHDESDHSDEDDHDDHSDEDAHEHGDEDPHVWLDPLRVAAGAELIAAELAALAPDGPWVANAAGYAEALRALDAEIVSMLEVIPEDRRAIITNHEALGYFAERYDLEVVGVVIPGGSTLADPSSAELAGLVELIEDEGVSAIFAETIEPSVLADAVAAEVGERVQVIELFTGSLGGPGSGGETYIELIRTNAERIAAALG